MTTTSTEALEDELRTHLLGFTPMGGATPDTLGEMLEGFFWNRPSEHVQYPYALARLSLRTSPLHDGARQDGDLEIQLWGRNSAQQPSVSRLADIVQQALLRYRSAGGATPGGVVLITGIQRDALPVSNTPTEREVVGVRLSCDLIVWPQFLNQYA